MGTFDEANEGDEDAGTALQEEEDPKATPKIEESGVGDGGEQHDDGKEDERLAHAEESATGKDDEQDSGEEEDGKHRDRDGKTARERRLARNRNKALLRAENQALSSQVQHLMQRLSALETGQGDSRLAILDSEIKRCSDDLATADQVYVAAVDANAKGQAGAAADVLAAQRFREDAKRRADSLTAERQQLAYQQTQARSMPPPQLPPPGSAIADQREAEFKASRPWLQFDPTGRPGNIESGVARAISAALRAEGADPATPDYWQQLDTRLRGALPQMHAGAEEDGDDEEDGEEEDETPPRTAPKVNGDSCPAQRSQGARTSGR